MRAPAGGTGLHGRDVRIFPLALEHSFDLCERGDILHIVDRDHHGFTGPGDPCLPDRGRVRVFHNIGYVIDRRGPVVFEPADLAGGDNCLHGLDIDTDRAVIEAGCPYVLEVYICFCCWRHGVFHHTSSTLEHISLRRAQGESKSGALSDLRNKAFA